ncbi:Uncharacterised protein [Salmonella enterica subsp. enterica]|nr:Uncharacterised protein [Salmonella enterica subsp. enterica]
MKLQSRVVSVAFRAAAIKTFGTLWIEFRFTLQTRYQIRVSDVIATKRHGVNQPFFDQIFRFFWRIGASADDGTVETCAHFFTERVAVRFAARPVWFRHMQISNAAFA